MVAIMNSPAPVMYPSIFFFLCSSMNKWFIREPDGPVPGLSSLDFREAFINRLWFYSEAPSS
jgi:hypothetical protein